MKVKDIMKKLVLGTHPTVEIKESISKTLCITEYQKENRLFGWEASEVNKHADKTVNSIQIEPNSKLIIYVS